MRTPTSALLVLIPALALACRSASASSGLALADMDRSVAPGDDFYRFVNGGWLARNPVPADESAWGVFDEVGKHNELALREILEQSLAQPADELQRKLGDFYATGIDETAIEAPKRSFAVAFGSSS